jgi:enoyl-CoA hydratase
LINKVVPSAEIDKAVDDFVAKLKSKSPSTLGTIKQAINEGLNMDLESALRFEAGCFAYARATEDATEGLKAFLEKRRPEFKGR